MAQNPKKPQQPTASDSEPHQHSRLYPKLNKYPAYTAFASNPENDAPTP